MPYKVIGKNLLHEVNGKWSVKQHCSSHANAMKAMGLLEGLEHGTIKPEDVGKPKGQSSPKKKFRVLFRE